MKPPLLFKEGPLSPLVKLVLSLSKEGVRGIPPLCHVESFDKLRTGSVEAGLNIPPF